MINAVFKKASLGAFALLYSITALSGGGGSNTELPEPSTCNVNCGFETGPVPNLRFVEASRGPLSTATIDVSSSVDGFGGGTVYYPTGINQALAAVSIAPGFTNTRSAVAWWGPLLASHGFVVITIDTNSRFDQPESRGRQLDSALSFLIDEGNRSNSPLSGLIDETRLATMGFSMGGGGALHSASRNRLSASIPLAPFNLGNGDFADIGVPTLIMACENDGTAPVNSHARPFYNTIPDSADKAFMEVNNGPHNCANGNNNNNALLSTYGVSWLKRFLDKDRRFDPFLCGPNHVANNQISDYLDTCDFL